MAVPISSIIDLMKLFNHSIVAFVLSNNFLCLLPSDVHGISEAGFKFVNFVVTYFVAYLYI